MPNVKIYPDIKRFIRFQSVPIPFPKNEGGKKEGKDGVRLPKIQLLDNGGFGHG
jgi:hypothetical protein